MSTRPSTSGTSYYVSPPENVDVFIKGDLHIDGSFTCAETTAKFGILTNDTNELKNRILQLEHDNQVLQKMVNEMYYAPGMPGYELANIDFQKRKRPR